MAKENNIWKFPILIPRIAKHSRPFVIVWITCAVALISTAFVCAYVGRPQPFNGLVSPDFNERTLALRNDLVSVDAVLGTATFTLRYQNDTGCLSYSPSNPDCAPVDIYFDRNTMYHAEFPDTTLSNQPSSIPTIRWDPSIVNHSNMPLWRYTVNIFAGYGHGALQDYPFDSYYLFINLYALKSGTNESVQLSIDHSSGNAIGYILKPSPSDCGPEICQFFTVERPLMIKLYGIIVTSTICGVTTTFITMIVLQMAFRFPLRGDILVVLVASLFTIPSLRSSLPGAPEFGTTLDFAGLIPCLGAMAICAMISIYMLAKRDFHHLTKEELLSPCDHIYSPNTSGPVQPPLD